MQQKNIKQVQRINSKKKNAPKTELTFIVACRAARIASLSACLTITAVLVDFLIILSPSMSSGTSLFSGMVECSVDLMSLPGLSSFERIFFFFFFFVEGFPGKIRRFFVRTLKENLLFRNATKIDNLKLFVLV